MYYLLLVLALVGCGAEEPKSGGDPSAALRTSLLWKNWLQGEWEAKSGDLEFDVSVVGNIYTVMITTPLSAGTVNYRSSTDLTFPAVDSFDITLEGIVTVSDRRYDDGEWEEYVPEGGTPIGEARSIRFQRRSSGALIIGELEAPYTRKPSQD
jgi:hypothetical protein